MRLTGTFKQLIAIVLFTAGATSAGSGEAPWPQFRGPDANPVGAHAGLPDRWSKTENVEWMLDDSRPRLVVADRHRRQGLPDERVTTDGASKPPQIGTDYSNEYVAELSKQGLSEEQVLEKLNARDIENAARGHAPLLPLLPRPRDGHRRCGSASSTAGVRPAGATARTASCPRRR